METSISMQPTLSVYEVRRWDSHDRESWRGALIIAANNQSEAFELFWQHEDDLASEIVTIDGVFAIGVPRVLYDDELR